MARGVCRCCGGEYNVNADGRVRYHLTDNPECREGPDSRKCHGVGQRPRELRCENCGHEGHGHADMLAEGGALLDLKDCTGTGCTCAQEIREMDTGSAGIAGYVCRVCKHPVQLTANDRARSHLDPRTDEPCDGGSDWPLAVDVRGNRTDTAPDPHQAEADASIGQAEVERHVSDATYAQALQDGWESRARQVDGPVRPDENQAVDNHRASMDLVAGSAETQVFDPTHVFTDDSGIKWVHPGRGDNCRMPECCTHPDGWVYGDDDNGRSGEVCRICGALRPEPCAHPGDREPDWRTPAHLLADMPEGVRRTAETNPECWDCGHEVTPRAAQFGPDSKVTRVAWECSRGRDCRAHETVHQCRPQLPQEARVDDLQVGTLFRRHTSAMPDLVYRAVSVTPSSLTAIIVTPGPYAGREGQLTNTDEEITCTDLDGRPRPRRTPSAPERPVTAPDSARSSTPGTTPSARTSAVPTTGSRRATSSGPTEKAGSSTPSAPRRSAVPDAFATPKQAVKESDKYDGYGRYKILHPDTGKKVNWTRATTFAKSIQDTFALSMWSQRMTLKGASLRPDIVASVATLDVKQDKDRVNALVDDAKKAAGDKVAANLGTAVHGFTEDRDKALVGMPHKDRQPTEDLLPTVQAYEEILTEFGLEPVPGLIEFTTAVKQYEVAGTSDRVYRITRDITVKLNGRTITLYAGEYVVGDVKTGADLSYGWQEICIQLALYAQGLNTSGVWDWAARTWARPVLPDSPDVQLKVRTDVGLVPHLPVDRSETGAPLATLYAVDLDAGWAATVLCGQVRSWRKERRLATPLEIADVAEPQNGSVPGPGRPSARPVVASRPVTLEDKARAVTSRPEASAVFQEAKAARVTVDELNRLTRIMQDRLKSITEPGG